MKYVVCIIFIYLLCACRAVLLEQGICKSSVFAYNNCRPVSSSLTFLCAVLRGLAKRVDAARGAERLYMVYKWVDHSASTTYIYSRGHHEDSSINTRHHLSPPNASWQTKPRPLRPIVLQRRGRSLCNGKPSAGFMCVPQGVRPPISHDTNILNALDTLSSSSENDRASHSPCSGNDTCRGKETG